MADALPIKWIEALFARLTLMWGKRFAEAYAGIDAETLKRAWSEELAGLTSDEIKTGLEAVKSRPHPPTAGEFITACRPQLEPTTALYYAQRGMRARKDGLTGEWPHPAIFWAAVDVGMHDMLQLTTTQLLPRWTVTLQRQAARKQWEPIPEIDASRALPAPVRDSDRAKEIARDHMAKIKEILSRPSPHAQIAANAGFIHPGAVTAQKAD